MKAAKLDFEGNDTFMFQNYNISNISSIIQIYKYVYCFFEGNQSATNFSHIVLFSEILLLSSEYIG